MNPVVLDIGNCDADHASIRQVLVDHFRADVQRAHGADDAFDVLRQTPVDLILVNRILDRDGSNGLALIQAVKQNPTSAAIPTMLISNYELYQQQARSIGAVPGFGKASLHDPQTLERFRTVFSNNVEES